VFGALAQMLPDKVFAASDMAACWEVP